MGDFVKKWMIGVGCSWLGFGSFMAYVHFGGWLPKTDKYLEQKYIRGAENHEKLDLLDEGLEKRLEKRRELRKLWMSYDGNKT